MKITTMIQANGYDCLLDTIIEKAKREWVGDGKKVKDIEKLDLYIKPEEEVVYYVINETYFGKLSTQKLVNKV